MSQPDNSTKASLGCGSLILIAIIVLIFSNGKNDEIGKQLRESKSEFKELKAEIATQAATLSRIEKAIEQIRKETSSPRSRAPEPSKRPE